MPKFAGTMHDELSPTPISWAEVEPDRLLIRHGSWVYEAKSGDGFYYEGNYGERQVDPDRILRCWLYPGPDGSKIVYSYWHNQKDKATQGESVFRLVPERWQPGSLIEMPEEWDVAKRALDAQAHLAPGASLKLLLVYDRWTGYRSDEDALAQAGLYILFYGSGKIARIGQASRSLAQRLPDYELNVDGWFCYRWVGVIPIESGHHAAITPLEDHLLATLKPPENTRGVNRRSP